MQRVSELFNVNHFIVSQVHTGAVERVCNRSLRLDLLGESPHRARRADGSALWTRFRHAEQ